MRSVNEPGPREKAVEELGHGDDFKDKTDMNEKHLQPDIVSKPAAKRTARGSAILAVTLTVALALLLNTPPAFAATAGQLKKEARAALDTLYKTTPAAKILGADAKAILVFPRIIKGGFIVGGQYGEGVLFQKGKVTGYYSSTAASYGLQAGLHKFGYALFFIDESDLDYLHKSSGWEIGVGPTLTVVDSGVAASLTTTTARSGVYAFFFSQKGLMGGLGLQGAKLTEIHPEP